MELRISSQEAASTFDTLLDQVSSGGGTIVIERNGKPVGRLVPVTPENASGARPFTADDIEAIRTLVEPGEN